MDNFFIYEGIFFWRNQKFGIFGHILRITTTKKKNFWFIAVIHGVKLDFSVRRRDLRRPTRFSCLTP